MKRKKILVRGIAVYFILLGVWYIYSFLLPIVVEHKFSSLKILEILLGCALISTGNSLFGLNESGRQITIYFATIHLVWGGVVCILILALLVRPGVEFNPEVFVWPNLYTIGMVVMPFLFSLLVVIFLRQCETIELFSAKALAQTDTTDSAVPTAME
jgi:uncharacterized membrane protein